MLFPHALLGDSNLMSGLWAFSLWHTSPRLLKKLYLHQMMLHLRRLRFFLFIIAVILLEFQELPTTVEEKIQVF